MDRTGRPEQIMSPALRGIIKKIDLAIENGSLDPKDRDEVIKMFISRPTQVVDSKAGGGMMNIDEMIRPIGMAGGGNPMDELLSRRAMIAGQLNAERGVPGVLGGGINEQKVRVLKIELDRIDRMISMIQGKSEE